MVYVSVGQRLEEVRNLQRYIEIEEVRIDACHLEMMKEEDDFSGRYQVFWSKSIDHWNTLSRLLKDKRGKNWIYILTGKRCGLKSKWPFFWLD